MSNVTVRLAKPEDAHLPVYRFSQLDATNRCPTLGALLYKDVENYGDKSAMSSDSEETPTGARGAGKVCHEVYAAVRLLQLWQEQQCPRALFEYHGVRLFGEKRFEAMLSRWEEKKDSGERSRNLAFCLEALYSSGYQEAPGERTRTAANLEMALTAYIDRWDWRRKVWVRDINDPKSDVGIEMHFQLTIEIDGKGYARYEGTIDGLHHSLANEERIVPHENKSGSRINDIWAAGFLMSHQVTGYTLAASLYAEREVEEIVVLGMQIPTNYASPIRLEVLVREPHHFHQWLQWFVHSVRQYEVASGDILNATKYTHSCNRFFSKCEFIPFCHADPDTKAQMLEQHKGGQYDDLQTGE